LLSIAGFAAAETIRLATFHTELNRRGPGLLLRDILSGTDPQVEAVAQVILAADADVILLLGFDYDEEGLALSALAARLEAQGRPYAYRFAPRPNTGLPTGVDVDGDGRTGGPRDAQGYGRFAGEGGMALLSRLPIERSTIADWSELLWRDLPGARVPAGIGPEVLSLQRLSSTVHWKVAVRLDGGQTLSLLAWHATPPAFDGPDDRNGWRNHDETALWLQLLDGTLPGRPDGPFAVLGNANLDSALGEGRREALTALLDHPLLQDPAPQGARGHATVDFGQDVTPGILRVDYVLPAAALQVTAAGVLWPEANNPLLAVVEAASRHRLVWVDLQFP
jgi:hypothetical protein